jgi:flagellar biosynthesis/type III secretory pathway M-ring protein FliF/YscJ
LVGNIDNINFLEDDIATRLKKEEGANSVTLIGVGAWLAVVTIATIVIFIVVYKRLGRNVDSESDAEMGSKQANCSIVNVSELIFPALQREEASSLPEKCNIDSTELSVESPTNISTTSPDMPTLHTARH